MGDSLETWFYLPLKSLSQARVLRGVGERKWACFTFRWLGVKLCHVGSNYPQMIQSAELQNLSYSYHKKLCLARNSHSPIVFYIFFVFCPHGVPMLAEKFSWFRARATCRMRFWGASLGGSPQVWPRFGDEPLESLQLTQLITTTGLFACFLLC